MVETNPDSCFLQPENALVVEKWTGDVGDKGLVGLIPFLECNLISAWNLISDLANQNFKDFRPILTDYKVAAEKKHISIPQEFARREILAREVQPLQIVSNHRLLKRLSRRHNQAPENPGFHDY
jgi:mitochondrial import inner membrane translocase subunit TIM50